MFRKFYIRVILKKLSYFKLFMVVRSDFEQEICCMHIARDDILECTLVLADSESIFEFF